MNRQEVLALYNLAYKEAAFMEHLEKPTYLDRLKDVVASKRGLVGIGTGAVAGGGIGAGLGMGIAALFAKKENLPRALRTGAIAGLSAGAGIGAVAGGAVGGNMHRTKKNSDTLAAIKEKEERSPILREVERDLRHRLGKPLPGQDVVAWEAIRRLRREISKLQQAQENR